MCILEFHDMCVLVLCFNLRDAQIGIFVLIQILHVRSNLSAANMWSQLSYISTYISLSACNAMYTYSTTEQQP
jgi:hypothetical protein